MNEPPKARKGTQAASAASIHIAVHTAIEAITMSAASIHVHTAIEAITMSAVEAGIAVHTAIEAIAAIEACAPADPLRSRRAPRSQQQTRSDKHFRGLLRTEHMLRVG